jgi:hypothetical protein
MTVAPKDSPTGEDTAVSPSSPGTEPEPKISFFGARARARELHRELEELRTRTAALGLLPVAELQERRDLLESEIAQQEAELSADREKATATLEIEAAEHRDRLLADERKAKDERAELTRELESLRARVTVTEETAVLQEVGVYEYRHPLDDSVAYQSELKQLKDRVKTMSRKDGGAVLADTDWTVNGSKAQGRKMVREYSKLMLRSYNSEADVLVRGMKPYKLDSAVDRLNKSADTIARLGSTMNIRISPDYRRLRIRELELTADYLAKREEEKEREREERQRLKEEQQAQRELEAERRRLEKEQQHYLTAYEALLAKGDDEAAARLKAQLEDVEKAIADVDYRAANVRAGYVYVISNVGSFGDRIVKIGMTRRLEPKDRVRELGDASVPFKFDVHALHFSDDAVGIETELHHRFADRRVNRVNNRREFFYTTPQEVKDHLKELAGELLTYEETAEAAEYHQSVNSTRDPAPAT